MAMIAKDTDFVLEKADLYLSKNWVTLARNMCELYVQVICQATTYCREIRQSKPNLVRVFPRNTTEINNVCFSSFYHVAF